jgi:hypothetical protein
LREDDPGIGIALASGSSSVLGWIGGLYFDRLIGMKLKLLDPASAPFGFK